MLLPFLPKFQLYTKLKFKNEKESIKRVLFELCEELKESDCESDPEYEDVNKFFNKDASPEINSEDSDNPSPDNSPNIWINYNALNDPRARTLMDCSEVF